MDETITRSRKISALIAVLLGQFMLVLDATVVNVALPAIRSDLGMSESALAWVNSAYLIAFGGLLLLFGRLGDLFGRRRIFLVGLGVFTAASVACGLAPSSGALVVARFVQGVGAAASSSVILALISTEFPDEPVRSKAMSGYMFVSVAGGSLGLFVGGLLTQTLGWNWVFLINVPFGLIAFRLGQRAIRETASTSASRHVDYLGALLVTASAMTAIYGLVNAGSDGWTATSVRAPLALALVLAVVFFVVESIVKYPLMPLRIVRLRSLVVSSVVRGLMTMGLYGVFVIAALDMAGTLGFGPFRVGLAFLPQTLVVAALSLGLTARLVRRFGPQRVLVVGLAVAALGLMILASLDVDAPYFPLRGTAHVLLGLGFGAAFLPLLTIAMSDVRSQDAGLGSAIVNLSMQLSAAVSIAILVTAATSRARALVGAGETLRTATVHGYRFAYEVAIVGLLVGVTLAATLLRRPSRSVRDFDVRIPE